MSVLKEKITVGVAGNMYSSAGHEMLMDINGTPLGATDDKEFKPEVQYNDYCIEVSHREDYILYTYVANPATVHSYGASRPGSLWIALTVPSKTSISGSNPFDLLMEILETFRNEYMLKRADGSYEFKEINCVSTPIRNILDKYQLHPCSRYVPMRGSISTFVKTESEVKMRDFLRDTQYDEFKDCATIIAAENVNGNYLNLDIPRPRVYEVYVNGNRQSDIIGAPNGVFDKTFQKDYYYPVRVDFSIPVLWENNGQKTVRGENGNYEVKVDEVHERVDVKVIPREMVYSHDVRFMDYRLYADEIRVTLEEREHKIETGQDGPIVNLIGVDEEKSRLLKFSHSRYELDVQMDDNGVYSISIKSTKFQGTKCIIYGNEKDTVTIYYTRHEYEGETKQIEIPDIKAENIQSAESERQNITYVRTVLTSEDGWDRVGFYQEVRSSQPIIHSPAGPTYINKVPQYDNREKHRSEDEDRHLVISKDRRLEDLNAIYVECIFYPVKDGELPDMFRIKRRFKGQDNITIRIPDIYDDKDVYKVIVYKDMAHSSEFVIEDNLEVCLDIDTFYDGRTGKKRWPFGNFSCRKLKELGLWLIAVLIVVASICCGLYFGVGLFANETVKKFTTEKVQPIDVKIAAAADTLSRQPLSISQMESVLKLCDEAGTLLTAAEDQINSSDLNERQINKLKKGLEEKGNKISHQEAQIKASFEADAARYYKLMTDLRDESDKELTFAMTRDIQKWVKAIDGSHYLRDIVSADTNKQFVAKYIRFFVDAVDEVNRVKDGKGKIINDSKVNGVLYRDVNNPMARYSKDTELRTINGYLNKDAKLWQVRLSLQKLYLFKEEKGEEDIEENKLRKELINKTILTKRNSKEDTLIYSDSDTTYIVSFNDILKFKLGN